jgi:hypothetical protein
MLHPDVAPGQSELHGTGMIALRPLAAGTVVWAPCKHCAVWRPEELVELAEHERSWLNEFGYCLNDESILLVCRSGYLFNHSCTANVENDGLDFAVVVHDIPDGGELTIDYRAFRNEPYWTFWCRCGTSAHRVTSRSAFSARSRDARRRALDSALTYEMLQKQALAPQLTSCSNTYQQWLRTGRLAYDVGTVCDPRSGLEGSMRDAYLRQEMGRTPILRKVI